ncbi:MAG: FitA-like ribbon-helix-helix domain-containing protein [Thermoanaerobaculia bacterium]
MAKQLTIRGVPDEVARRLERLSQARGQSINTTVLQILEAAVGVDERRKRLARYATWSYEDRAEFDEALALQRAIGRHVARERIQPLLDHPSVHLDGSRPSRDELHER